MTINIEKLKRRFGILVFVPPTIMIFIFLYDSLYSITDCIPRDMVDFKKSKVLNGVVYKTFLNADDHNHYYIYIQDSERKIVLKPYYNFYGSDLSKVVSVGDTILKEQDSMSFILKNNGKMKLVKFDCDVGNVSDLLK